MPLRLFVDRGGEKFVSFAKKKLTDMKAWMLTAGVMSFTKHYFVSTGERIRVSSLLLPEAPPLDTIRIIAGASWIVLFQVTSPGTRYVARLGERPLVVPDIGWARLGSVEGRAFAHVKSGGQQLVLDQNGKSGRFRGGKYDALTASDLYVGDKEHALLFSDGTFSDTAHSAKPWPTTASKTLEVRKDFQAVNIDPGTIFGDTDGSMEVYSLAAADFENVDPPSMNPSGLVKTMVLVQNQNASPIVHTDAAFAGSAGNVFGAIFESSANADNTATGTWKFVRASDGLEISAVADITFTLDGLPGGRSQEPGEMFVIYPMGSGHDSTHIFTVIRRNLTVGVTVTYSYGWVSRVGESVSVVVTSAVVDRDNYTVLDKVAVTNQSAWVFAQAVDDAFGAAPIRLFSLGSAGELNTVANTFDSITVDASISAATETEPFLFILRGTGGGDRDIEVYNKTGLVVTHAGAARPTSSALWLAGVTRTKAYVAVRGPNSEDWLIGSDGTKFDMRQKALDALGYAASFVSGGSITPPTSPAPNFHATDELVHAFGAGIVPPAPSAPPGSPDEPYVYHVASDQTVHRYPVAAGTSAAIIGATQQATDLHRLERLAHWAGA